MLLPFLMTLAVAIAPTMDDAAIALRRDGETVIDRLLAVKDVVESGRTAIVRDAIASDLVLGTFVEPSAGATIHGLDDAPRTWEAVAADDQGRFAPGAFASGYGYARIESDAERVMMLEARGHRFCFWNGEPRGGDIYDLGLSSLPVLVREGTNHVLFRAGRGRFRARLVPPPAAVYADARDATLPEWWRGAEGGIVHAGIRVTNASTSTEAITVHANRPDGSPLGETSTMVRALEPSRVEVTIDADPTPPRVVVATENVRELVLDLDPLPTGEDATIVVDGQPFRASERLGVAPVRFSRRDDRAHDAEAKWRVAGTERPERGPEKSAARSGPFKAAFRNRMIFVYGTQGTPAECAWSYAKARFDAETPTARTGPSSSCPTTSSTPTPSIPRRRRGT